MHWESNVNLFLQVLSFNFCFFNPIFIDFQVNRPDNHRRKWDKDEYEKKAKERDDEEKEKRREHAKGMNDAAMIRASAKASGTWI